MRPVLPQETREIVQDGIDGVPTFQEGFEPRIQVGQFFEAAPHRGQRSGNSLLPLVEPVVRLV